MYRKCISVREIENMYSKFPNITREAAKKIGIAITQGNTQS